MRDPLPAERSGEGWTVRTQGPEAGTASHWEGRFDDSLRAADVRLSLPARPESVAVVRHVLGALADALGLPAEVRDDLRLAVTEAATNVVRHAYREDDGRIDVLARPVAAGVLVAVSDEGAGIGPSPDAAGPGFGIRLIASLADRFEIDHAPGMGSRLQMWFARHRPIPETA